MRAVVHPSLPDPGRLYAGPRPAQPFDYSVAAMVARGITGVACLLEPHEFPTDLRKAYDDAGLEVLWFPIPDFEAPDDPADFTELLRDLRDRLGRGESLYVHCLAGIGRTGTLLSCFFKYLGAADEPLTLVRSIYASGAVESPAQQRFIERFDGKA